MYSSISRFFMLVAIFLFAGCATIQKPLSGIVPGRETETIQSSISISIKTAERSTGGRGYLIFKQPDRFHLAVLSPFGSTLLEVFSDSERLTCLIPSEQTAYSGLFSELPDRGALNSLALMKWVIERPPLSAPLSGPMEIPMADGRTERIYFDQNGLVQRKVSGDGDEVVYKDYQNVNGVAFPASIEFCNRRGDTVRIVFDEPEINQAVEDVALTPNLQGITVLPLTEFKGF